MTRLTAADFHPEVLKLFDRYVHGGLSRRGFLDAAGRTTAAGATGAAALLAALSPDFAAARQIEPSDNRITTRTVQLPSPQGSGSIKAYQAMPANAAGKLPTVLVVHENRGLNPHIEDIARRLAVAGYLALAPDALTSLGGYPASAPQPEDAARELFTKLDQTQIRADFLAAFDHLKALPEGNGKAGAVGFCYGGGIVNYIATQRPELAAGVPFYGAQPKAEDAARIKAPLSIQYAGEDERINAGAAAYEAALKAAGVRYEAYVYPGVQHGFNNDTTPRYDEKAAALAWKRTLALFDQHLKT